MKFSIVLSTRPEIIKLSPFIKYLKVNKKKFYLINTKQHILKNMSNVFFDFFKIKEKIYNINPSKKSQFIFLSESIKSISKILITNKPDFLVVQGDTNTCLAGCLSASLINRSLNKKDKIKIVHIESGLRSFDDNMPEEINRKIVDKLSDILFVPTKFDLNNLKKENHNKSKIIKVVGNTITDVLKQNLLICNKSNILRSLGLKKDKFFLATLHRPESVDNYKNLLKLSKILRTLSIQFNLPIVFPVHPRTKDKLKKFKIKISNNIKIIEPLRYTDFIKLLKETKIVLTDSGGIQEEAAIMGTPCITLRTTTERQITIMKKVNFLAEYDIKKVQKAANFFSNKKIKKISDFGDGNVSVKIYKNLIKIYNKCMKN